MRSLECCCSFTPSPVYISQSRHTRSEHQQRGRPWSTLSMLTLSWQQTESRRGKHNFLSVSGFWYWITIFFSRGKTEDDFKKQNLRSKKLSKLQMFIPFPSGTSLAWMHHAAQSVPQVYPKPLHSWFYLLERRVVVHGVTKTSNNFWQWIPIPLNILSDNGN